MPARLFCKTGELAGSAYTVSHQATIGRMSENEITLHPSIISGRHARIYFDAGENAYFLEDLGSSNGTALDGIAVREAARMGPLHVITFADQFDFIFQEMAEIATEQAAPAPPAATGRRETVAEGRLHELEEKTRLGDAFAAMPPLQEAPREEEKTRLGDAFAPMPPLPVAEVAPDADETLLVAQTQEAPLCLELDVTMNDGTRQTFALKEGENVVGRDPAADVVLPGPAISRRHALFTLRAGRVTVQDLGSKNYTYVAGERITAEVEIAPGTPVRLGHEVELLLRRT